jgi:hypothetical protein
VVSRVGDIKRLVISLIIHTDTLIASAVQGNKPLSAANIFKGFQG